VEAVVSESVEAIRAEVAAWKPTDHRNARMIQALLARLAEAEKQLDEISRERQHYFDRLVVAETERDRYREAMASALTSLGTGPTKDGYAYAVLDAALDPEQP
jgi:chromosome segregation ATPase